MDKIEKKETEHKMGTGIAQPDAPINKKKDVQKKN